MSSSSSMLFSSGQSRKCYSLYEKEKRVRDHVRIKTVTCTCLEFRTLPCHFSAIKASESKKSRKIKELILKKERKKRHPKRRKGTRSSGQPHDLLLIQCNNINSLEVIITIKDIFQCKTLSERGYHTLSDFSFETDDDKKLTSQDCFHCSFFAIF